MQGLSSQISDLSPYQTAPGHAQTIPLDLVLAQTSTCQTGRVTREARDGGLRPLPSVLTISVSV